MPSGPRDCRITIGSVLAVSRSIKVLFRIREAGQLESGITEETKKSSNKLAITNKGGNQLVPRVRQYQRGKFTYFLYWRNIVLGYSPQTVRFRHIEYLCRRLLIGLGPKADLCGLFD